MTDPTIKENTSDFQKGKKKAEGDEKCTSWYTRQGALQAICKNTQDALDKAYYEQLQDDLIGYKLVTIEDYFKHIDDTW